MDYNKQQTKVDKTGTKKNNSIQLVVELESKTQEKKKNQTEQVKSWQIYE